MDNLAIQLGAQGNRAESPASVSPGSTASPENSPSFAAELGRALESELAPPQLHPSDEVGEAAEATEESPLPDSEEPSEETSEKSSGVERVSESTRRHQSTLEGLLAKVPDSAKPALEHALEASAKGTEAAVAALGRTPAAEGGVLSDSEVPSEEISEKSSGVERVSESTRRHQSTLEGVLEKAPGPAKPALEHALEVSARGTEAAVAALGKTPVAEASALSDSEVPSEEISEKSSGVERVSESTRRHQPTLEGVLAKVPDSAKPALEHALEASARGTEAAVAALGKTPAAEGGVLSDSEEPSEEISEKSSGAERVSESTRRHQSTLEGLLAKVPDSAKPALEHALEASAKGTEAAVAALGKSPVAEGTESDGVPVEPEPLVEKQAGAFSERGARPPALRSFQDAIAEATSTSGTAAQDRDNSSTVSRKAVTDRDGEHPPAQAAPAQPLATRPRSVEARAFSIGIDSAQADASPVNKVQADELEAQTSGQDDDSAAANRSAKSEFDLSTLNPEDKGGVVVPFRVSISEPSSGPAGVSLAQHPVRPPTNTIANSESAPAPGAYKADLAAAAEVEYTRPGQIVSSARLLDQLKRVEMQIAFRTEVFGSVQLRTMIRNGQIGATIGVEKGEAQALLTSELPALERALAQRDLRVDNISIFQQSTAGDTEFSHGSEARSDTYPHRRQQAAAWSLEAEFEDSTELSVELYGAAGSPTRLSVRA